MKLLVTGPNGQLGHDLVSLARDAGHSVTPLPREELDLATLDPDTLARALDPHDFHVLVNCAAYTRVDDAESDRDAAMAVNTRAPGILAAACAERGARLVQPSTDYVFDGRAGRPYAEDHPTAPLNVYGASKLEGEALARSANPDGTLVVRTASLFGLAGPNFVETMIRRARDGGPLRVVNDIVMSPTATADLANAILQLLENDVHAGTYHLVNAGAASWYDFARAIIRMAGSNATVQPVTATEYPTPARRPAYSVLDTAKARALGCEMRPWQEALAGYMKERQG